VELTAGQKRFFADFGYLSLPGLMAAESNWISEEFEAVFRRGDQVHDGSQRTSIGPFIEQSARLCTLVEHPLLAGVLNGVLGRDFNYLGSGGELYVGDGMWHPDGMFDVVPHAKLALYLDPLTRETGSLRLVPGSHRQGWEGNLDPQALWGLSDEEVPCVAPDNEPGDVLVFNLNTLHNSIGGGNRRRMLNITACAPCQTREEIEYLDGRLTQSGGLREAALLRQTATPQRMRHLRQVMEREESIGAGLA
jgi:hypothetical protein